MNIEPAKPNTPKPQRNHHSSNRKITANVGSAAAVAGLAAVLATTAGGSAAPQPQHHSTEDEPPHSPNLPPKARGSISRPNAQKQMGNSISIGNHANIHRKQSGMVVGNSVGLGLSQPNATGGRRLSPNNKLFLDVPTPSYYQQSNSTERVSLTAPVSPVSTPSPRPSPTHPTSSSPLSSLSRELKQFRKRSLSEISLILEIIRGATAAATAPNDVEDEEGSPRRQRRIRTASPRPSTSASLQEEDKTEEKIIRRISLSAGNLSPDAHHGSHSTEGRPSGSVGKGQSPTATLSRISSFLREHRKAARRIRWERLSPQHIQKQMDRVQEEKAMQMAPTAPIDASRFVAYVQERRKKRILFKGEYLMVLRSIDPQKCTTEVGIRMGDKNQYSDTLPYDYNRVILEPRGSYEDTHGISDYINASYVQSWLKEKAYVVTQAVKTKQASNDFWRCIWELRANCIVMLTKVFDFMRVMCLQYWPIGRFQFGEIDVETLETKTYGHFVIRTFRLKRIAGGAPGETEETRIVKHFHFTEWELNSFPYISAFIELRRRVRQWTDGNPGGLDGPVVVHCSNGGGRSGAFLALDANLELMQRTGQIDVYEYAKTLVNSRQHLIESVDQYTFLYDALCEAVMCNLQPIEMHQLKERSTMYKSKKDRELMELQISHENKLLLMLSSPLRIGDCAGGHRLENRGKNRDVMVVPPDHARPYLQTLHGESKDYTYINAVEVDGFTRKSEFIVTEWPKAQTLDSFWTLVFDHSVHTVINLTNFSNNKLYPPFIHNKGKKNYGPFTVEIMNIQQYPGLTSYMAKITKRTMEDMQKRKPSAIAHFSELFGRKWKKDKMVRRPTLKHFLADCNRRRSRIPMIGEEKNFDTYMASQSFRLQQKYWGRVRSTSLTDPEKGQKGPQDRRRPRSMDALLAGDDEADNKELTRRQSRKRTKKPNANEAPKGKNEDKNAESQSDEDESDEESEMMWPHSLRRARAFSQPNLTTLERFEKTFMISEIMATGASQQQLEAEVRLCCVIQVKMWPIENKVPCSTSALIDLIKMTRSWRKRAPDRPESKPTIVMSHNGVSRCGIFIGANICIDQMDMDHEVDVFHAVKMTRINRPQLLQTKDEYKYLYDFLLHWYMTNPDYRVFEPPEPDMPLNLEDDIEEEPEELPDTGLAGFVGAITGGLTRSRSGSRRTRQSMRSRQSPPATATTSVMPNNCVAKISSTSTPKKETIYLN